MKGQGCANALYTLNGYLGRGEVMHGSYDHRRFAQDPHAIYLAIEGALKKEICALLSHCK